MHSIYTRQKRNTQYNNITVKISGRSHVIGQFRLYLCKGMSGIASLHVFCNQVKEN